MKVPEFCKLLNLLTLKQNQVFDTYLKSDEQHEVAGQKTNHGGSILCH
jgi:hypothetical protein